MTSYGLLPLESGGVRLPCRSAEPQTRSTDLRWIASGPSGEVEQQGFIARDVVEDGREKSRCMRLRTDFGRTDAGEGEKATQPLGLFGKKRKRLNRQKFRGFTVESRGLSSHVFAFP